MEILTNIINPVDKQTTQYQDNYILEIEEGIVKSKKPLTKEKKLKNVLNLSKSILLPPMIDAHTHIPQIDMMGKYGGGLIEWLNEHTYPNEIEFGNEKIAKKRTKKFLKKLKELGTTTTVAYSSIHSKSTEIVFEEAIKSKMRIWIGKAMMDQNCLTELCENRFSSIVESNTLEKKYHLKNDKVQYIYSPRFAISTSSELLWEIGKTAKLNKLFIQIHLNENKEEKELVKKLYPEFESYTDIYYKANILGPNTLLAHCIHCTKKEFEIIEKTKSNIIHCPEANLFLKSGKFKLKEIEEYGIPIGLGSDIGAGTTLDMFEVMKSMIYMQEEIVPVSTPFYYSTLGNAKILQIDNIVGSIDVGKKAEFLKIDCNKKFKSANDVLNHIIFIKDFKREILTPTN